MAGRFPPFDPNNPHNNPGNRVTNAQMRAALGLPSVDELSANLYVEQQQRLEVQQRDLRYRHSLYQDQLDHQLQELQLRANAVAELEQIPDLQTRYAQLLRAELARGAESDQAAAAAHQRLNQEQQLAAAAAYRRQQEHHYTMQLRHQQELIRQQQAAALQAHLARSSSAAPSAVPSGLDQLLRNATSGGSPMLPTASGAPGPSGAPSISQLPLPHPTVKLLPHNPAQNGPGSLASGTSASGSVQEAPPSTKPKMAPPAIVHTTVSQPQPRELSRQSSVDSIELEDMVIEQHKKSMPAPSQSQERKKQQQQQHKKKAPSRRSRASSDVSTASLSVAPDETQSKEPPTKRKRGRPKRETEPTAAAASKPVTPKPTAPKQTKKKEKQPVDDNEQKMRVEAILQVMAERAAGMQRSEEAPVQEEVKAEEDKKPVASFSKKKKAEVVRQITTVTTPVSMVTGEVAAEVTAAVVKPAVTIPLTDQISPILTMGTVDGLLEAAKAEEKVFNVAHVLEGLKKVEWPDSDDENEKAKKAPLAPAQLVGLPVPLEPLESIVTAIMESHFPRLPEEPVFEDNQIGESGVGDFENKDAMELDRLEVGDNTGVEEMSTANGADAKMSAVDADKEKQSEPKKSRVLDYPYPVDTWWPSSAGRRRERRHGGETSDEDAFEEPTIEPGGVRPTFRANDQKIRHRLQTELEPGVLEKLPHCRIHRMKRKNASLAELVYCFQVTECYPKDVMVCCSVCGTWRHAACGGHYEPYSVRKNIEEAFVAICEQCHEEQRTLEEYPLANARMERRRMEQLRRGLATTAVMRSMSFSKHGGTYKWPLGSVSATHVGGHTRSVQARHDKAEKQWADLLTRLGRGYGYRTKERQRIRTKELERLLVAIEDAEGQTDRHNMLLFLMRDTQKPKPAGFEEEHKNLFDPCYPDEEFDSLGYTPTWRRTENQLQKQRSSEEEGEGEEETKEGCTCVREDCQNKRRFDSLFCSDGCGVHVLEKDLLQAFYESNEIHPSVLRSHY